MVSRSGPTPTLTIGLHVSMSNAKCHHLKKRAGKISAACVPACV